MGFEILTEVVPELKNSPEQDLGRLWRGWINDQPNDVRLWMTRPLKDQERRVLQCGFAADYYQRQLDAEWKKLQAMGPKPEHSDHPPSVIQAGCPRCMLMLQEMGAVVLTDPETGISVMGKSQEEAEKALAAELEKRKPPPPPEHDHDTRAIPFSATCPACDKEFWEANPRPPEQTPEAAAEELRLQEVQNMGVTPPDIASIGDHPKGNNF